MDKQATLCKKLIKAAVANPEKRDRLLPIIAALTGKTAMEFDTQDALDTYLKAHPAADRAKHKVKKQDGGGAKKDKKPAEDKPRAPQGENDPFWKHKVKVPEALGDLLDGWHGSAGDPVYEVASNARSKTGPGPSLGAVNKAVHHVKTYMGDPETTPAEWKKLNKALGLLQKVLDGADAEASKDGLSLPKEHKTWQGKPPKAPAKSEKTYKKPVQEVVDAYKLTDDDVEEVKSFKKKKPARPKEKLSDAQLMANFLKFAKPETRERMKGVTPAEFVKMLGAIMDDEEVDVGGKKASTDKTAGLVTRIDRVKLTYTFNAFLEYLLGDPTDAILRLRKLRMPSVTTDGYSGIGSALWTELYERWMLVTVRTLMKYKGVEDEGIFDELGAERVPVMASAALRKARLKRALAHPELRDELLPLIKK